MHFPTTQVEMNLPQDARYKTFEVAMNKRHGNKWSASIGGGQHVDDRFPERLSAESQYAGRRDRTGWGIKASGSYDGPWGVRLSPILRHQSGANYARTNTIAFPAGVTGTGTAVYMDAMNANREQNIWVFDVRAEKTVTIVSRLRARLFLDLFNITNSHADESISRATGTGYQSRRPSWRRSRCASAHGCCGDDTRLVAQVGTPPTRPAGPKLDSCGGVRPAGTRCAGASRLFYPQITPLDLARRPKYHRGRRLRRLR